MDIGLINKTGGYNSSNVCQRKGTGRADYEQKTKEKELFFPEGDMIIQQPPLYTGFRYDSTISVKSKEEMTLDEYKQWFTNEMSQLPVSGYYRESFTGSLVITEEAFEKMKADPEWEKTVLNMLKEMYSVNGLPQKSYCYQVIGASPAETYGYSAPTDSGGRPSASSGNTESWWSKRRERMEALLEEQAIQAQQELEAQRRTAQLEWLNSRLIADQRIQSSLSEARNSEAVGGSRTVTPAVGVSVYEEIMDTYEFKLLVNIERLSYSFNVV